MCPYGYPFYDKHGQAQGLYRTMKMLNQAPTLLASERQIHINFNHMNHARFSVDGGLLQNIVPLSYGVKHEAYFPERTSLKIPDLQGFLVFSLRVNTEIHPQYQYFISGFHPSYMVYLTKRSLLQYEDGTSIIRFGVNDLQPVPELGLANGSVGCYTFLDDSSELQGPICYLLTFVDAIREYNMQIGGIGIDKLFGETQDGYTFKAFRYDYCEFNERDITYVCEYDYSQSKQIKRMPEKSISKLKNLKMNLELTGNGKINGQAYEAFNALKFDFTQKK